MKIQLKRSDHTDSSGAIAPNKDAMEYGELAVNFHSTDPTIFIKDSSNEIIEIASKNATAQGRLWTSSGANLYPTYLESKVGIGTTSPSAPLTIQNSGTAEIRLITSNDSNSFSSIKVDGSASQFLTIGSAASGAIDFKVGNTVAAQINSSGYFGIKKEGPTVELDVAGSGKFTGKVTTAATVEADPAQTLVTKGYVDNTISGNITGAAKWVEKDGGILHSISTIEKVGIGTETPAERLDVNGNIRVNGSVYVNQDLTSVDNGALLTDKAYVDARDRWVSENGNLYPKEDEIVCIGIEEPDDTAYKLHVEGDLYAVSFRIDRLEELP